MYFNQVKYKQVKQTIQDSKHTRMLWGSVWLRIVDIITSVYLLAKKFMKENCMQPNVSTNLTVVFFNSIEEDKRRLGQNVQLHTSSLDEPFG